MDNHYLIPQEKWNYCVCSALQAVFFKYGIKISQKEISEKLTPTNKGFRVDDKKIKIFMKELGFDYEFYWYNETPFNEPDELLKEMKKAGIVGINNHVYLMCNFKDPDLVLGNPKNGWAGNYNLYKVIEEMEKSKKGFFGLIKKIL